jgi:hypothetical protein
MLVDDDLVMLTASHVGEAERRVARQARIVGQLRLAGQDVRPAAELLETFRIIPAEQADGLEALARVPAPASEGLDENKES